MLIVAVGGYGAALLFALLPVDNPPVQDCGVPVAFTVSSTADAVVTATDGGQVADPVRTAAAHPCSERVSDRMGRALVAFGWTTLGVSVIDAGPRILGAKRRRRGNVDAAVVEGGFFGTSLSVSIALLLAGSFGLLLGSFVALDGEALRGLATVAVSGLAWSASRANWLDAFPEDPVVVNAPVARRAAAPSEER